MNNMLDIHTHHLPEKASQAIVNVAPQDFSPRKGYYYSVGYHPWHLSKELQEDWSLLNRIATHPQVLAIGEAGLDKIKGPEPHLQEKAFEKQICIALLVQKPLMIHCVRAYNELIQVKKTFKPDNPWIIHGFRGKEELAGQLLDHGFHLSFGEMYQEEALQSVPLDRLFFETDESTTPIYSLYRKAANLLDLPIEKLMAQIQQNISNVFFKKKSCFFE